ncbi:carbamate kinase [Companilactobacillus nodensis]|uniref:Carbamate kinase n=1 Tax=Companilactobacillus nodensis DSM 19682 = JCM 14932 = NBRC 107160 TaxID=1423775 RepID=A0A0R1K8W9_9LACO|nr:carbamate kinase [Companilactobacillus nodensis]KRK79900.1 carbamate kinase [Companilactobacillus nodensis DSM 19682 = JCM 14932 = NBRC 107160]
MTKERIVVALGGNAILSSDASAEAQQAAVKKTCESLVEFVKNGQELIITHGNGPQVGNLLLQQAAADSKKNPALPLDTCGAMTEGSIGYWFQNAMKEVMLKNGINKQVVTLITQTIVDKNDPAFGDPSKPIGPFYKEEEVAQLKADHPDWSIIEDAGRGYRRVVPSPKPVEINEYPAIKAIAEAGVIPIVAGGGGIPVVKDGDQLIGKEAVIDKDFGASKIAQLVNADKLIILTSVGGVFYNFGKPNQEEIFDVTADEVQEHIDRNEFAKGSMMPKVKAAVSFVQATGKPAVIGALEDVKEIIAGDKGTVIHK